MNGPVVLKVWSYTYMDLEMVRDSIADADNPSRTAWRTKEAAIVAATAEYDEQNSEREPDEDPTPPLTWETEAGDDGDMVAMIDEDAGIFIRVFAIEVVP